MSLLPTLSSPSSLMETELSSDEKLDRMSVMLCDVKKSMDKMVSDVYEQCEESKSQSKFFNQKIDKVIEQTSNSQPAMSTSASSSSIESANPFRPLYSQITKSQVNSPKAFPRLGVYTPKRRRVDMDNGNKRLSTPSTGGAFKGRKMVHGTANDHGLTAPAQSKLPVSPYAHLTKSMYLSNFSPTTTADMITALIKRKLPTIDDNDFKVRILVKKDQPLNNFTFISFRISCTDELYPLCSDPSIWPDFAVMGQWLDKPRQKRKDNNIVIENASNVVVDSPNETPVNNGDETPNTDYVTRQKSGTEHETVPLPQSSLSSVALTKK